MTFERVFDYCIACKHLGHSAADCYIANPHLRKNLRLEERAKSRVDREKPQYRPIADRRPVDGKPVDTVASDHTEQPAMILYQQKGGLSIGEDTSDHDSSSDEDTDRGQMEKDVVAVTKPSEIADRLIDVAPQVRFNTHVMKLSDSSKDSQDRICHSDEDRMSNGDVSDEGRPASEPDMRIVQHEDQSETRDSLEGNRSVSADVGFIEPRTMRLKTRARKKFL